jgi:Na+/proline symporter
MPNASILGQSEGYIFLTIFWLVAFLAIRLFFKKKITSSAFLVSERTVGFFLGAVSVAVAWVWAPAFFVSSQKAYEQGIPGLFWFTLPNAGALILFAFLASRMRKIFAQGFTLPQYMSKRFGRRMELLYSFAIFVAQSYAVIINLTAALLVLNLVTGIQREVLIVILGAIMLSLSLLKGIRSSLVEDSIKAMFLAVVGILIVPWAIGTSGGFSSVLGGLGGMKGTFTNLFDPIVAWTFGVSISISLLSGITIDQQQWQRAFSMKRDVVKRSFLLGGLLFAIVPITLGLLGYVAANQALKVTVTQNQLAGFSVLVHFLPTIGIVAFTAMVLAGLTAAGSSALSAVSSIGITDIYKFLKPRSSDHDLLMAGRISMVILILVGMGIALIPNIQILYLVLVVGVFRAALFLPTILSLFWSRLSGNFTFLGAILGMLVGVPLFVYGSIVKNPTISSFGSLVPIIITVVFCIGGSWLKSEHFNFQSLMQNHKTSKK